MCFKYKTNGKLFLNSLQRKWYTLNAEIYLKFDPYREISLDDMESWEVFYVCVSKVWHKSTSDDAARVLDFISNECPLLQLLACPIRPRGVVSVMLIYMVYFGLVLWHINHCWLFHVKSTVKVNVGEDATPFPGLLHFTLDMYLIMLNVKQGGIKYHFWVFVMTRLGLKPGLPSHWRTLNIFR